MLSSRTASRGQARDRFDNGRRALRRRASTAGRGPAIAHGARHVRRRHRAARHAARVVRAQPVRACSHREHRPVRGARARRRVRGVRRGRPQPRCARAVVHDAGTEGAGHAAPATRGRRSALCRRPGRARCRGELVSRGGRGRARRCGVRAAPGDRRLRQRPGDRGARTRGVREQRRRAYARTERRSGRSGIRGGAACGERDDLPAGLRSCTDGDSGAGRGVVTWQRRAHDLGRHAGAPRNEDVLLASARGTRAPRSRRDARHRRRLRSKGRAATRGDVRDARGAESSGGTEVDRGPAREPHGGGPSTPRARGRRHGLRRRRHDPRHQDRSRPGRRRLPDTVAGRYGGGHGHAVPGPVPDPARHVHRDVSVLQHRGSHRVSRAVGVRVGRT